MQAVFLMTLHPAVVGPEHYLTLESVISVEITDQGNAMGDEQRLQKERRLTKIHNYLHTHDISGDRWCEALMLYIKDEYGTETQRKSDVQRRPTKGGMPITYTMSMAKEAYPGCDPLLELLHNKSPQSDESEIAATAIGIISLPHNVATEVFASEMLDKPLNEWWKRYAASLSRIKRSLTIGQTKNNSNVLALRKILNVTIRTNEDAQMVVEDWNRIMTITRKHVFGQIVAVWPMSAYTKYELEFKKEIAIVVNAALSKQHRDKVFQPSFEFWQERGERGASGASKMIRKYDVLKHVPQIRDSDRPGKRVLVEYLRDDALKELLEWQPQQRAYYFVKPEPGHKQRALFATSDEESFVCAYANCGIENVMGHTKGVFVRQTPADVIEWMAVSSGGLAGCEGNNAYWVSTDYSDYNSEHTILELMLMDRACAQWYKANKPFDEASALGAQEKQAAHNWLTIGRKYTIIKYYGSDIKFQEQKRNYIPKNSLADRDIVYTQNGNAYNKNERVVDVINGLFSGSRTTARDNTWKHAADMQIAKTTLNSLGNMNNFKWYALCGDDEDAAFDSIPSATIYLTTLQGANHDLNPIKQLAGAKHHEFLQFIHSEHGRIEKSSFTLMATLATGNWYTQRGVWIQSAVSSVLANYWELYCRGIPLQICRRLATSTLDRLMKVKKTDENGVEVVKELEWWKYRYSKGLPPLFKWDGNQNVIEEQPRFEAIVEPDATIFY